MRRTVGTPKLSPPRQANALARPRLFNLLDQARAVPMLWISGPAGAGKTTLMASYLAARARGAVWYQFDATDTDPGTLFHYLKETLPPIRIALPDFVERYRAGPEAFAHGYFRQYFQAQTTTDFVLILDGAERSPSQSLLEQAAEEVPEGFQLVVLSREPPTAAFARLELQGRLIRFGFDQLRFTEAETLALVNQELDGNAVDVPKVDVVALHGRSGGWAAGVRLLIEQAKSTSQWPAGCDPVHNDALFRFITNEVFEQLAPPQQAVLQRTCLLPEITARHAAELTRDPRAHEWLERLSQRHLFVDRLQGIEPVYRLHDLFREFLVHRAGHTLSVGNLKVLQRQTGELLAGAGRIEHAIGLLTSAGEWLRASQLIVDNAASMMARGHAVGLRQLVQSLPGWYVDATPRLLYCLGMAQSTVEPEQAMCSLERAYQRFDAQRNALGQALCAAGIVQAYYFRLDCYLGMERWGHALAALLSRELDFPSPETELHLQSMMQLALTYRDPAHIALAPCARRIIALLSRDIEVNQRVVAGALLLPYCDWIEPELSPLVIALIDPLLKFRGLTHFNQLWWLGARAQHHYCGNSGTALDETTREMESVAQRGGLQLSTALPMNLAIIRMATGVVALDGAATLLRDLRQVDPRRRQERLNTLLFAVDVLLQMGDFDAAHAFATRGLQVCRETGLIIAEMEALGLLTLSCSELGRVDEARKALAQSLALAQPFASPKLRFHHLLLTSRIDIASGRTQETLETLREALRIAALHGFEKGYVWMPALMSRICAVALEAGVEPAQARRIVRARKLPPPPGHTAESWPWHIRVRVLGHVEISVDDQVLRFGGKTQKKPLELLRALIARGPNGCDQTRLADDLWPDSEGDAAASNLRMTLHRLRRLLQHEQAIGVEGGRARLAAQHVWVDAWAMEDLASQIDLADRSTVAELATKILRLYRNQPFANVEPQPWILSARERWRVLFIHAVDSAAQSHSAQQDWARICEIYEAALAAEPSCERFFQGLIRAQLTLGKLIEAHATYRRCVQALNDHLGLKPSRTTEALGREIDQRNAA